MSARTLKLMLNRSILSHGLAFLLLMVFGGLAHADTATSTFDEGLQKFRAAEFPAASEKFEEGLKANPTDSAALINNGLALTHQKKWGLALAHLRQAQLLSPRRTQIQESINFIKGEMKSKIPLVEDSLINSFETTFGQYLLLPELLAAHWTMSLILLIVFGKLFRDRRRAKKMDTIPPGPQWRHWTVAAPWLVLTVLVVFKIASSLDQKATVVASGSISIRSGPLPDAAILSELPEGALITVRDYYKDWVQVHFADNPVGWIPRKEILLLTPAGLR